MSLIWAFSEKLERLAVKLSNEEIVAILVLREKGETHQQIAERLGITEGAVRYHLKRQAQQLSDGRSILSLI